MNVTCETANDAAHEQPQVLGQALAEADHRDRTPAIPAPLGSGSIALAALGPALFALTSVCAMRLILHRAISPGDWLTGLCAPALSEASLNDVPADVTKRLLAFRHYGMHFAIREFGTSHNGLASIKSLPATKLEADPAFVEDLPRNQFDAIIVTSMIDLAHDLGKKFVADGVSSTAQLKFLRARGCDIAQGPVHGKPADAAAFTRILHALGKV